MTRRASGGTASKRSPKRTLSLVRTKLEAHYGPAHEPTPADPFALILWEQVGYLIDDDGRLRAFRLLEERVGLAPQDILRAAPETLTEVAAAGGSIAAHERAERMRKSAIEVTERWGGDLRAALALPLADALRALKRFPMIGEPGAEKILLVTRAHPLLALDSNGLRVLLRLGYGREAKNYAQTYRLVRAATAPEERKEYDWLVSLHGLLRRHGQSLCRRSAPRCGECPLLPVCDYGRALG
jgi:endonuclease III